jgi:sugar-specific transcriptional regulator TrmB
MPTPEQTTARLAALDARRRFIERERASLEREIANFDRELEEIERERARLLAPQDCRSVRAVDTALDRWLKEQGR